MAGCLAACSTANNLAQTDSEGSDPNAPFAHKTADATAAPAEAQTAAAASNADPTTTGTVPEPLGVPEAAEKGQLGADPYDELSLGKREYRANNYGMAEKHFRRAVELHPNDAEAWLGLAACYDRLRRFDLADRAYKEAIRLVGPTVEILNNQGFSYMLRGDYRLARAKLMEAERKEPDNKFVQNNLKLLEASWHERKAVAR
jgi:Flp pilus assembly protein TadD